MLLRTALVIGCLSAVLGACAPNSQLAKPLTPLETQIITQAFTKGWLTSNPKSEAEIRKMASWLRTAQTSMTTSATDQDLAAGIQKMTNAAPAGWGDLVGIAVVMLAERTGALNLARNQQPNEAKPYLEAIFIGIRSVLEGHLPEPPPA